MEKFLSWIEKNGSLVLASTVVLFLVSASGAHLLRFSTDFRVYLGSEHPDVEQLELIESKFTKNETIYVAISPKNKEVFNTSVLTVVEELTDELWNTPFSKRVDSLSNFQYSYADEDDIIVEDLISNASRLNAKELDTIKNLATNEPFLSDFLISSQADVTAIQVTLHLSDALVKRMSETPQAVSFVRDTIGEYQLKYPDYEFYIAGSVLMNQVMGEAALQDILTLIPLCYLAIIALMAILLRSVIGVVLTMSIVTLSNGFVLGITGWASPVLAPVIGFVPNAILVIAVADCIHILTTFFSMLAKGTEKSEAVKSSIKQNFSAVTLTSVTTIIGFLCLNFNESPPYRDLGNMVALGTLFAYLLSIVVLPTLLFMLPIKAKQRAPLFQELMPKLGVHVLGNYKIYFSGSLVLIATLAVLMFGNRLNDNWNNYFNQSFDLRVASDQINESITGLHRIDYEVSATDGDSISNSEYLVFVDYFSEWLRAQPEVRYVSSVADVMKRLNRNMHEDDPAYYQIPDDDILAAQYMLFYEMSLPYGLDMSNQVSFDKNSSRITLMLDKTTSEDVLIFAHKVEQWLDAQNTTAAIISKATGLDVAFANIARSNTKSMIWGTFFAFALISVLIGLVSRSAKYGAVSIAPNVFPAVCAFGIWALTVQQIGLATSAVVSMAIGIIVDDTVHFLSKYRYARERMFRSVYDALIYSYSTVGVAMVITTIILVCGFLILGASPFEPTSQMGNLLALTIFVALFIDLILLPCLLLIIDSRKERLELKQAL